MMAIDGEMMMTCETVDFIGRLKNCIQEGLHHPPDVIFHK